MAGERIRVTLELDDRGFVQNMRLAGQQAGQFDRQLRGLGTTVNRTERQMQTFTGTIRDWTLIVGQSRNAFNQLSFLTLDWMRAIIRANAEVERMTNLMKGFSDATTEFGRLREATGLMDELFERAKNAPFSLRAMGDAFVKMKSVGLDPMTLGLQELTDAVANFGGTDEVFHRASIAIQQMAGKGVISMEELRQQLGEAVPEAIRLMARALGTDYATLVDQVSKGTVEADFALRAMFREMAVSYAGRAVDLMDSFNGQIAKLQTNMMQLASASPGMKLFFDTVTDGIRDLNAFLESPRGQQWASDFGFALSEVALRAREVFDVFWQFGDLVKTVFESVAVAYILRFAAALTPMRVALAGIGATLAYIGGVFDGFTASVEEATNEFSAFTDAASGLAIDAGNIETSMNTIERAANDAAVSIGGLTLTFSDLTNAVLFLLGPIGRLAGIVMALSNMEANWADPINSIRDNVPILDNQDIEKRAQALRELRRELENTPTDPSGRSFDEIFGTNVAAKLFGQETAQSISNGFREFLSSRTFTFGLAGVGEDFQEKVSNWISNNNYSGPIAEFIQRAADDFANDAAQLVAPAREKLQAEFNSLEQAFFNQREEFARTVLTGRVSQEIVRDFDKTITDLAAQNNRLVDAVEADPALNKEQVAERVLALRTTFYDEAIAATEGQIAALEQNKEAVRSSIDQLDFLASQAGVWVDMEDPLSIAVAQRTIIAANEEAIAALTSDLANLQRNRRDAQEQANGPRLTTGNRAGTLSKEAREYNKIIQDLSTARREVELESERLSQLLVDPFSFQLPDSIDDLAVKLADIRTRMADLAAVSPQAASALSAVEEETRKILQQGVSNVARTEMVALQNRTREIRRSLMTEREARKDVFDEEIQRIESMKQVLLQAGADRVLVEQTTNQAIAAITDQYFRENENAVQEWTRDWETAADQVAEVMADAFRGVSAELADLITKGKMDLQSLAETALNSFLRVSINAGFSALGSVGSSLFNDFFGSAGSAAGASVGKSLVKTSHTGSIIGQSGGSGRIFPMAAFATAPRFHTGGIIGSDEVPAILQKGEGVFTQEQMKALGGMSKAAPEVVVNVINQSGQAVTAQQGNTRFDGRRMVLDVVLDAARQPGAFRDNMKAALK